MRLPLVVVRWNDAFVDADTPINLETVRDSHKPTIVTTIGWVLWQDEVGISVANEFYDNSYRGRTFIPFAMIISVTPYNLTRTRKLKAPKCVEPSSPPSSPSF